MSNEMRMFLQTKQGREVRERQERKKVLFDDPKAIYQDHFVAVRPDVLIVKKYFIPSMLPYEFPWDKIESMTYTPQNEENKSEVRGKGLDAEGRWWATDVLRVHDRELYHLYNVRIEADGEPRKSGFTVMDMDEFLTACRPLLSFSCKTMPPKTKENQDPDYSFQEPSAKKRKSLGGRALKAKNSQDNTMPSPSPHPKPASNFTTQPTIDELIYPDATYQSFDEFDSKFNTWKDRHHHPFRVASSEALRTQEGTVSERFKYRYVVFHCARYGAPRMRGEGKRPNQNYLPCSCTAMIRLNFSYTEQCLKLTSLETRHSNHEISKELYDRMVLKEKVRKNVGAVQKKAAARKKEKEMSEERTEDETFDTTLSTTTTSDSNETVASEVQSGEQPVETTVPQVPVFDNMQLLTDYRNNLQNQLVLNQMQLQSFAQQHGAPYTPLFDYPTPATPMLNPFHTHLQTSQQPSPSTSSSADENEAPTFTSLETVRPIALRPSENSAFHKIVHPQQTDQASLLLGAASKLLGKEVPVEVLNLRMSQLSGLISLWSQ